MRVTDAELVIIKAHTDGCSRYVGEGDVLCGADLDDGAGECGCLQVVRQLREAIEDSEPKLADFLDWLRGRYGEHPAHIAAALFLSERTGCAEENCPGHVASANDPKVCGRCGTHIDSLRPPEDDR